jgi:integrase
MGQQKPPGLTKRGAVWHIDKDIFGRAGHYFGIGRQRSFREAATKFLEENQHKRSLDRDARALAAMDRYIGELPLRRVHYGTLQPYVKDRMAAGKAAGTVNRDLAVVRRILNLCARLWRDENDRPWLETAPLIQMQREIAKRGPYPLSFEEERLLFSELAGHLARMAIFKVNTGTREHEVLSLRWDWEVRVPELETSVFVVPRAHVKNGMERVVVLNRIARSVIESCRGEHRELVFTHEGHGYTNINNSGWQGARRRAAERYEKELGGPCPDGFRSIRVHDLKHTYGYRLRAAGVQFEDRQLLLGHKATHVTTHYSAADIGNLIAASEKVCELASRKSPAVAIVRARGSASA